MTPAREGTHPGEDHRVVGEAKEQWRPGGMRSQEDEVWRSGPCKSLGTTVAVWKDHARALAGGMR